MREFLHSDDLGEACVFALEHWSALSRGAPLDEGGEPLAFLNVGTGIDLSISKLSEIVAAAVDFNGLIRWDHSKPDGTPKKQLNVSSFQSLGWNHEIQVSEGLARTVAEFQEQFVKAN